MSGKGSTRRPGEGYADAWDRIFNPTPPEAADSPDPVEEATETKEGEGA